MAYPPLAVLLEGAAEHHDPYEKSAPKHDEWNGYAAYTREQGNATEAASVTAGRYMEEPRAPFTDDAAVGARRIVPQRRRS